MPLLGPIYVLGAGAIGFPLAAHLVEAGREVIAVRTSRPDVAWSNVDITSDDGDGALTRPVPTISLAKLSRIEGVIVVAAKAHANAVIARDLRARGARGPVVILQNGVGVEDPYVEAGFTQVHRCVLYFTSQAETATRFRIRAVAPSPIGAMRGDDDAAIVATLTTRGIPFRVKSNIQREVWKKAVINAVFNSVCPLLEVDNGIFIRDEAVAAIAREILEECTALTSALGVDLRLDELMEQLMRISRASDGQAISTLQDIRKCRPTEIEFLNLAIARIASSLRPPVDVPRTAMLGRLIQAKSLGMDNR